MQETEHELWTLLELDKALIKKHPGISEKQAHGKVKHDLVVLKKLYPEDKHILNQLKSVEKEIKVNKSVHLWQQVIITTNLLLLVKKEKCRARYTLE